MIRRFRETWHVELRTDRNHPVPPVKIRVEYPIEENLKAWVKEWSRINPGVTVYGFDAKKISTDWATKRDKLS